jgi:hypothetical protein
MCLSRNINNANRCLKRQERVLKRRKNKLCLLRKRYEEENGGCFR